MMYIHVLSTVVRVLGTAPILLASCTNAGLYPYSMTTFTFLARYNLTNPVS